MIKRSKIWERIQNRSKNVRFQDFQRVLEGFGWELDRIKGSHHTYKHELVPNVLTITADKNGYAMPYQVKKLMEYVAEYSLVLED